MNRIPVSSQTVSSIGYDEDSQILEVEFVRGGVYQYMNVPSESHDELMNASSIGNYMNTVIKKMFTAVRVG